MMNLLQVLKSDAGMLVRTRPFHTTSPKNKSYQLVIVGGGTGGCATAAKFSSKLGRGKVAVIEPNSVHYYQPMWTLVGGGMKTLKQSGRPMMKVLPKKADWIQQSVSAFKPQENKVVLKDGTEVGYDFLVIALGLQLNYEKIKGLPEAFDSPGVCSNYSAQFVNKTFQDLQSFKEGSAIFTVPNTVIKCAGAPQKIMYLAEEYLRKNGKREKASIIFATAGNVIFAVKKYANALLRIIEERNISTKFQHNLVEVNPLKKEAIFQTSDESQDVVSIPYELLHITPPMSAPDVLREAQTLVDMNGFLNVNRQTLQHVVYPNVFGIGDCTNVPTSKTAAAAAAQVGILRINLNQVMNGKVPTAKYDGYTSCPLVTGYSKCILAEFDFNGLPLETFPLNQAVERRSMFYLKRDMMPIMYWQGMLKGYWEGPQIIRKLVHLGLTR